MLFNPITVLLRYYGLKRLIMLLAMAYTAGLLMTLWWQAMAIPLLAFNAYITLGLMICTAADIDIVNEYLVKKRSIPERDVEQSLKGLLMETGPLLLRLVREDTRTLQNHRDINSEINHSALEINSTSTALADNIKQQSGATDSIAAAVTQISQGVEEIATQMQHVYEVSTNVHTIGKESGTIVKVARKNTEDVAAFAETTYDLLSSLEQRTTHVASISSVIRDMAAQTNLLALNAAIEAARAGEHGRGFAVVAEEVRALAIRSDDSAKEIASNIDEVQNQMNAVR